MNRLRRAPVTLAALALVGAVAAACTTTSAGEPRPQSPTTGASSDPTSTIEGLPPRPREITLDDVDPCTLIPEADYPDYHLDEPGESDTNDQGQERCTWIHGEVGYFGLTLNVEEGVEIWLDGSKVVQGEPVDPILEFGAVNYRLDEDLDSCFVSVDVADGQQLTVQIGIDNTTIETPPACEYAHEFATSAMRTLVES